MATLSGIASIKDGDGILFGEIEVRLQGIAAPEQDDPPAGPASTDNLRAVANGKFVVCHLDGTTAGRTMRPAGICYVGDLDLGHHQVATGHALDCPAYSGGRYTDAEQTARSVGNDLSIVYDMPGYCN